MPPIRPDSVIDVYARVSRLGDERMRSTEGQAADCRRRVEGAGAQVGEVFIDPGKSAWNPRVKRLRWHELMERLESGASDGVCVFDLARFSRRPIEGERLIAAAERGLIVWDSEGEYDLTSASGKKAFRDQMTSAAYESDRTSTRVKRGKRLKAARGESNHSSRPWGFEPDGYTPREPEATELRAMVARFLAGESQDDIILDLNARGVSTSYGRLWNRAGLRQVLTRPRNAGLAEYQGEILGTLPGKPLIERADWDRVVAMFAARRRGRPESDAYQSSGVIVCGLCGKSLTGRPMRHMARYPDGGVRRQYWCQPRAVDSGCGRITVDQRGADETVREMALAILADPRHVATVEAAARAVRQQRRDLEIELAECERIAEELAGRLGRREISLARHDAAVRPLDQQIVALRAQLDQIGEAPAGPVTDESRAASREEWEERWDAATVPGRRGLIRQALRGRRLLVMPATPGSPRVFDPSRLQIGD